MSPPTRPGLSLVVSGGQTGVDRAALDAAGARGLRYGGWCPRGGLAEDHNEPPGLLSSYPELRETPSSDPRQRTEWNVRDSDATLLLCPPSADSPGSLLTEHHANGLGRPILVIDPALATAEPEVRGFVAKNCSGGTLNVAGPRESEMSGIYGTSRGLLDRVFDDAR